MGAKAPAVVLLYGHPMRDSRFRFSWSWSCRGLVLNFRLGLVLNFRLGLVLLSRKCPMFSSALMDERLDIGCVRVFQL